MATVVRPMTTAIALDMVPNNVRLRLWFQLDLLLAVWDMTHGHGNPAASPAFCRRGQRHGPVSTARRAGVQAMWEAIDRYAVLVFHDQRVSDEQFRDFAGNFGKLEIGRSAAEGGKRRLALPEIGDISNLDEEGRLRTRDDRRRLDSLGNRIWHIDASYMPVPVVLGMLHAVAVPPASALGGGETEFADMRAAYDGLPKAMKEAIDGLVAEHDVFWSRGQIGFTEFLPGER